MREDREHPLGQRRHRLAGIPMPLVLGEQAAEGQLEVAGAIEPQQAEPVDLVTADNRDASLGADLGAPRVGLRLAHRPAEERASLGLDERAPYAGQSFSSAARRTSRVVAIGAGRNHGNANDPSSPRAIGVAAITASGLMGP